MIVVRGVAHGVAQEAAHMAELERAGVAVEGVR
jgi:hypothetical protein